MPTISFCGAAGTVTGSCSLLDTGQIRMLVDCGMFQGNRSVRELNYQPFPFDATEIDFLILTHAHIDHSGLLPKLVKAGFRGPIYCTPPTADLLDFMLKDSAEIQVSNTERVNRQRQRRGQPEVEPLYNASHVKQTLQRVKAVELETWFEPEAGFQFRFWNAGHILGSASAEIKFKDPATDNTLRVLFSGDIGPDEKVFHAEPDAERGFDYVVCESTYGNRERDDYTLEKRRDILKKELQAGLARGGNVVIPSFAVERSQELLHDIGVLLAQGEIPTATVYLDSPLASKVTDVFIKHADTLDDVELSESELFQGEHFRLVRSIQESKAINKVKSGAIIISASGMCDAGRIKHHLKNNIWRPESTILFVGYQAPGTLGNVIASGKPGVRIHGKEYKVKAHVRQIGNYSAHADQGELIDWIAERSPVVGGLFLNHGEDDARAELRTLLAERGLDAAKIFLPSFDEKFELVAGTAQSKGRDVERIADADLAQDWYNDYAAFILKLADRLESLEDPSQRRQLIDKLASTIDA